MGVFGQSAPCAPGARFVCFAPNDHPPLTMWDAGGSPPASQPTAVEVHGLDAAASLLQLRQLFSQVAPVLQAVATLDGDSSTGLGLIIFATEPAAAAAVELFNGYPLGGSYLRVQRSDGLANSLVNLLYSLDAVSRAMERRWGRARVFGAAWAAGGRGDTPITPRGRRRRGNHRGGGERGRATRARSS